MTKAKDKDWLDILKKQFEHPAIVLWRAVELSHIDNLLKQYSLDQPILDLGCAEGKIGGFLLRGKQLIGLDNCWELLQENKRTDIYRALILADARRMPYKDAVFGSIFSNCVIEHIRDIDSVLHEAFRVLKDKGIFLFTVPSHKFADFLFFSVIFERLRLKHISGWYKRKRNTMLNHFHCYDHNQWKVILKKKGFNLIEHKYYMTKKATFIWDFLAAGVFVLKTVWPLNYLLPKISRWLSSNLRRYYDMDAEIGSGLLLVAQKRA